MDIRRLYSSILLFLMILSMLGCGDGKKQMNKRITLWRKDRIPYGTFYAFEHLKYLFPEADIEINKVSPGDYKFTSYADVSNTSNGTIHISDKKRKTAYIIVAPQVIPDEREINAILNFVGDGNQVFISAFYFGDSLLAHLKLAMSDPLHLTIREDSLKVSVYNPRNYDSLAFQYPGIAGDNSVGKMDSQYTTILGRDAEGRANFVKFSYKGGGGLFIHFAPLAFSNFFLLHKENKAYYENVFSYLPASVTQVKWDDYFRYPKNRHFSALQFILGNQSLRWAFWLILLLFLLIYVFESKRRQRMIPAKPFVRNSSLDFVKTIGRLYYQRKDNANLALKMITQWLDHVRTKYNLPTAELDDDFVSRLSYKSGYDKGHLQELVMEIKTIQMEPYITDESLLLFNKKTEAFYKLA